MNLANLGVRTTISQAKKLIIIIIFSIKHGILINICTVKLISTILEKTHNSQGTTMRGVVLENPNQMLCPKPIESHFCGLQVKSLAQ